MKEGPIEIGGRRVEVSNLDKVLFAARDPSKGYLLASRPPAPARQRLDTLAGARPR